MIAKGSNPVTQSTDTMTATALVDDVPAEPEVFCFWSCWSKPKKRPKLLPPANSNKKSLVIDLDETLVHAKWTLDEACDHEVEFSWEGERKRAFIRVRPGCAEFLQSLAEDYELIVFTASSQPYCEAVVRAIDPTGLISHKLSREHCTIYNGIYKKDLRRLGRPLDQCIIVDDRPEVYSWQRENAVPVDCWKGDKTDRDLVLKMAVLKQVAKAHNVIDELKKMDVKYRWDRAS